MTNHRACGDCQLCCRLLPTEEIGKVANVRCQHQRTGKGCAIHAHKPASCALWNCRWLVNDDMADQQRPDRTGIVVDMMPDIIRVTHNDTGAKVDVPVIVAWIDPDRPDAFRTQGFRRYVARQTCPVLIRIGSGGGGTVLFPPATTGREDIVEQGSSLSRDMPTTLQEKAAALGGHLQLPDDETIYEPATITMPDGKTITVATKWREQ